MSDAISSDYTSVLSEFSVGFSDPSENDCFDEDLCSFSTENLSGDRKVSAVEICWKLTHHGEILSCPEFDSRHCELPPKDVLEDLKKVTWKRFTANPGDDRARNVLFLCLVRSFLHHFPLAVRFYSRRKKSLAPDLFSAGLCALLSTLSEVVYSDLSAESVRETPWREIPAFKIALNAVGREFYFFRCGRCKKNGEFSVIFTDELETLVERHREEDDIPRLAEVLEAEWREEVQNVQILEKGDVIRQVCANRNDLRLMVMRAEGFRYEDIAAALEISTDQARRRYEKLYREAREQGDVAQSERFKSIKAKARKSSDPSAAEILEEADKLADMLGIE